MARNERGTSLAAGDCFAGRYRITGVVRTWNGRAVYGAIDEQNGGRREIRLGPTHPPVGWRARLVGKQATLASVSHPNLIRVHEVGDDPVPYLVTSVARGSSWREAVHGDDGTLDEAVVASTLYQLLDALQAMHSRGLLHGEITSGNLFVSRGLVSLLDGGLFGLNGFAFEEPWGRVLGVLQAETTRGADQERGAEARVELGRMLQPWDLDADDLQTLSPYLAPEVVTGVGRDARSDLYGVGVLLFELMSDEMPFAPPSSADQIAARCAETPPFVTDLNRQAPPFLAALCQTLLERRPADRLESAAHALERLEAFYGESARVRLPRPRWNEALADEPTLTPALVD